LSQGNINIIETGLEISEAGHKQVVAPEIMDMTRVNDSPLGDRYYSMEYKCREYWSKGKGRSYSLRQLPPVSETDAECTTGRFDKLAPKVKGDIMYVQVRNE